MPSHGISPSQSRILSLAIVGVLIDGSVGSAITCALQPSGSPDFQPTLVQADRDIMPAACSTEPRHADANADPVDHAVLARYRF